VLLVWRTGVSAFRIKQENGTLVGRPYATKQAALKALRETARS
jgi:hypothetical protein